MSELKPAPSICPSCPWRVKVTPSPEQVIAVQGSVRTGEPQPCCSSGDRYAGTVCLPWLATCGPDSRAVIAEVESGRLKIGALMRQSNWPALHDSPSALIAAVYRTPVRQRLDPVMAALRVAREEAGLSQVQVAARLGWALAAVQGHESGRRQPDLPQLRAYADAYGVDLAVVARR